MIVRGWSVFERLDSHEEFVIGGNLVLWFDRIVEVDSGYSAVGVDLYPLATDVLGPEGFFAVFFHIKNNFVPAVV